MSTDQCQESIRLFGDQGDRCELGVGHRGPHETTVWGPTVTWTANGIWTGAKTA